MTTNIFVNLPVKDLKKSRTFFTKLGYTFNEQFSNDSAACLVISDTIYSMLVTEPMFKGFIGINGQISDAHKSTETITSLSMESRHAVDAIVDKAIGAGATTPVPAVDHGFMYERGFKDLDGHMWSYFFMQPVK